MNELHLTIETTRRGAFRATYTIGRFLQRSTVRQTQDYAAVEALTKLRFKISESKTGTQEQLDAIDHELCHKWGMEEER